MPQSITRAAVGFTLALACTAAWAAPTYNVGETGVFGPGMGWNFSVPTTLNSLDDTFSARFTAFENQTVRSVYQRYVGGAGSTINIGIKADDGAGNPFGPFLASATNVALNGTTVPQLFAFTSDANLVAGQVYHLVTSVNTLGANVQIGRSPTSSPTRISDRRADPANTTRFSPNGGAFVDSNQNGWFALADDAAGANVITGPGLGVTSALNTVLNSSVSYGQFFSISDAVVPDGARVDVDQVKFEIRRSATGGEVDLTLSIRNEDGSVIASTVIPALTSVNVTELVAVDIDVELEEGVNYLLTLDANDAGANYFLTGTAPPSNITPLANASYGGTTDAFMIHTSNNNWETSYTATGDGVRDLNFEITGTVIPEPMSLFLVGAGAYLLVARP